MSSIEEHEFTIYDVVARNIKKYRMIAGITQAQLAESVGLSHEFIRRIESKKGRKSFTIDTVYKIAVVLNVPVGKFFDIDPIEKDFH